MDIARDFFALIGGTVIFLAAIAGIMAFYLFSFEIVVRKRAAKEVAILALNRVEKPGKALAIALALGLAIFQSDIIAAIGVAASFYLLAAYGSGLVKRGG